MKAPTVKRFYETVTVEPDAEGFSVQARRQAGEDADGQAASSCRRKRRQRSSPTNSPPRARRSIRSPCRSRGSSTRRSTALPPTRKPCSRTSCASRRPTSSATAPTPARRWCDRQAEAWDPIIDWARSALGARFFLAEGVMHVEQPREAIGAVGVHLRQRDEPFRLAALHVITVDHRLGAAGAGLRGRRDRCRSRVEQRRMSTRTGTSSNGASTRRQRRGAPSASAT